MPEQTILAFDFGLKKVGVALGNTVLKQAQPLTIIRAITRLRDRSSMPQRIVAVLPINYTDVLINQLCWSMNVARVWKPKRYWAHMLMMMLLRRLSYYSVISIRLRVK